MAVGTLIAATALAPDVDVDRLWVVSGTEVWQAIPIEKHRGGSPGRDDERVIEVVIGGGPMWEPGREVTLVLRVTRGAARWLVRAPDVSIERTS